jgi:hypothetical protein
LASEKQVSRARPADRADPVDVDEIERLSLLWPRHQLWVARARDPARTAAQRAYASARAKALRRTTGDRVRLCEQAPVTVVCQCGTVDVPVGCGQHFVCRQCRRKRWIRERGRIMRGFERVELADDELVVLGTFTQRHSGDVNADWDALAAGWRAWYKALHRRGWAPRVYVGAWEVTPGWDDQGHVHLHVAMVMRYLPWGPSTRRPGETTDLRTLWIAACPTSSHINLRAATAGKFGAGKYLAKYMTKGVDTRGFSPLLRARVLAASYQRRQIVSSVGFFAEKEPWCCRTCKAQFANLNVLADCLGIPRSWVPAFLRGDVSAGVIDDEPYVWNIDLRGGRHGPRAQEKWSIQERAS